MHNNTNVPLILPLLVELPDPTKNSVSTEVSSRPNTRFAVGTTIGNPDLITTSSSPVLHNLGRERRCCCHSSLAENQTHQNQGSRMHRVNGSCDGVLELSLVMIALQMKHNKNSTRQLPAKKKLTPTHTRPKRRSSTQKTKAKTKTRLGEVVTEVAMAA